MRHIVFSLCVLFFSTSAFGVVKTAVVSGSWSNAATWDPSGVPAAGDDVIIPEGITVDATAGLSVYNSITVEGVLNISGGNFVISGAKTITVESGGEFNVLGANDISFNSNTNPPGAILRVKENAKLYVGRSIVQGNNWNKRYIYNSGFIEIGNSIIIEATDIYNYATGTILVHGEITGGDAGLNYYNYGITTIDNNLTIFKANMVNYSTGMFIVYGHIYLNEGGSYTNSGLVQCNSFIAAGNYTGFNNTGGTLIVLENFETPSTRCPGCSTTLGTFYYNNIITNSSTCTGYASCHAFLTSQGKKIELGRRLWMNASFIGYGLQANNERIYQWFDLANYYGFRMAQPVVANRPYIKNNSTDNVNFNPVMSFDGVGLNMDLDNEPLYGPEVDGGVGIFAVVIPKNNTTQSVFDYGLYTTKGFGLMYDAENVSAYTPTNHGGALNTSTHSFAARPSIITQTSKWGGNQVLYLNGEQKVSNSISMTKMNGDEIAHSGTAVLNTSGPFTLGGLSHNPTLHDFDGKLAELIIYSVDVDEETRKATESFLALKYGITLPYSYTNYSGVEIFNIDATYKNCVVGLGRQDLNHLHQRQSRSLFTGSNLTLSISNPVLFDQRTITTQIANDVSFFVCAHNGNPSNDGTRIYKATTSNFSQEVTLTFKFTGIDTPYPDLTIDNVDSFTGSPVTVAYDSYDGTNLVYKYTFPNNATRYFKVGAVTIIPREPGVGINTVAIDSTAQLHVYSTNKGVLIPNVTTTQMNDIPTPPNGLLVYNTTQNRYMYNSGTTALPAWAVVGRFKSSTNAELTAAGGDYIGEIRYNTTDNKLWYWNGTSWLELKDN